MTLTEFLKLYKFEFVDHNLGNITYVAITRVIRRSDNAVMGQVKTDMDIFDTNNWIAGSQSEASLIEWDWKKLIEQTKRMQLDYFAQRIPITDFFPLNSETQIDHVYR